MRTLASSTERREVYFSSTFNKFKNRFLNLVLLVFRVYLYHTVSEFRPVAAVL